MVSRTQTCWWDFRSLQAAASHWQPHERLLAFLDDLYVLIYDPERARPSRDVVVEAVETHCGIACNEGKTRVFRFAGGPAPAGGRTRRLARYPTARRGGKDIWLLPATTVVHLSAPARSPEHAPSAATRIERALKLARIGDKSLRSPSPNLSLRQLRMAVWLPFANPMGAPVVLSLVTSFGASSRAHSRSNMRNLSTGHAAPTSMPCPPCRPAPSKTPGSRLSLLMSPLRATPSVARRCWKPCATRRAFSPLLPFARMWYARESANTWSAGTSLPSRRGAARRPTHASNVPSDLGPSNPRPAGRP